MARHMVHTPGLEATRDYLASRAYNELAVAYQKAEGAKGYQAFKNAMAASRLRFGGGQDNNLGLADKIS